MKARRALASIAPSDPFSTSPARARCGLKGRPIWQLRCSLAACLRIAILMGLTATSTLRESCSTTFDHIDGFVQIDHFGPRLCRWRASGRVRLAPADPTGNRSRQRVKLQLRAERIEFLHAGRQPAARGLEFRVGIFQRVVRLQPIDGRNQRPRGRAAACPPPLLSCLRRSTSFAANSTAYWRLGAPPRAAPPAAPPFSPGSPARRWDRVAPAACPCRCAGLRRPASSPGRRTPRARGLRRGAVTRAIRSGSGTVVPISSIHSSSAPCTGASHLTVAGGLSRPPAAAPRCSQAPRSRTPTRGASAAAMG